MERHLRPTRQQSRRYLDCIQACRKPGAMHWRRYWQSLIGAALALARHAASMESTGHGARSSPDATDATELGGLQRAPPTTSGPPAPPRCAAALRASQGAIGGASRQDAAVVRGRHDEPAHHQHQRSYGVLPGSSSIALPRNGNNRAASTMAPSTAWPLCVHGVFSPASLAVHET